MTQEQRIPWGEEDDWPHQYDEYVALLEEDEHLDSGTVEQFKIETDPNEWDNRDCHDCGAAMGELHMPGCDVEECPVCGHQMISCDEHWDEVMN